LHAYMNTELEIQL